MPKPVAPAEPVVYRDPERLDLPSASSSERFVRCPGSAALIRQVEPRAKQIEDEATSEGTLIHKALETDDYSELGPDQIDIVEGLKQQADALSESFKLTHPSPVEIREERMWVHMDGEKLLSAKPDLILLAPGAALVINHKSGYKDATPAHISWQSRTEALAVYEEYRHAYDLSEIVVSVSQFRFKGSMSISKYREHDLTMAAAQLRAAVWAAAQPDAQRIPGRWCDWCPAKKYCREHAAWCLLPSALAESGPLSIEDLAVIERRRLSAEKLFKAVTTELRAYSEDELSKVGLTLVENSPRRTIAHMNTLADRLEKNLLVGRDMLFAKSSISVKAVTDLIRDRVIERLKAKGLKGTGKEIAAYVSDLIAPAVETTTPEKSLAEKDT